MEFEKAKEAIQNLMMQHAGGDAGKAAILMAAALNNSFQSWGVVFRVQILGATFRESPEKN